MPKFIDLTGQRFGMLTCISRAPSRGGQTYWNCVCDCGNETTVRASHLRDGTTKSCGCYRKISKVVDMPIGSKWGRLTILASVSETPGSWLCKCDCGNSCVVKGKDLRRGHTKSCGCLQKENAVNLGRASMIDLTGQKFGRLTVLRETSKKERTGNAVYWDCLCECGNIISAAGYHLRRGSITSCGCIKQLDITGKKFGKLTALYRDNEFSKRHRYKHSFWKCKCECGNEILVYLGHLQTGHTTSCGCDKSSKGEKEITQILDEHNINYVHDKQYFKDLILPSGGIGRYDYVVFNEDSSVRCVIEFDGEQHYRNGWNSVECVQENDKVKNNYAFQHGIPIIRIPYWERGNIDLSMLFDGVYELTAAAPDMEESQEVIE